MQTTSSSETQGRSRASGAARVRGACVVILAGWIAWMLPIGLDSKSHELSFRLRGTVPVTEAVIIAMDEKSYRERSQEYGQAWDHQLHAGLLDRLTRDGARLVVMDVALVEPGEERSNRALREAIGRNGKVVLAGYLEPIQRLGMSGMQTVLPQDQFLTNAAAWGIAQLEHDAGDMVRLHYGGTDDDPSLSWAAASLLNAPVTNDPSRRRQTRWVNYYGPAGTVTTVSYADEQAPGFFRGKIVLIGGKPLMGFTGQQQDEFRSPFFNPTGSWARGVEIQATTCLNLVRGDWLERLPWYGEWACILMVGLLLGAGLTGARPGIGIPVVVVTALGMLWGAIWLFGHHHIWFAWLIPVGIQTSGALAWCLWGRRGSWFRRETPAVAGHTKLAALTNPEQPGIPDHSLVRCVGRGAYGEVWLASNAVGIHHAVKIVRLAGRPDAYEREFRGIEKFMPLSRLNPGFVDILQVGRNDRAGFFFYVMELADDEQTGQQIDPQSYRPRSLAGDLKARCPIPAHECLSIMLNLTAALAYLHEHQLVHRDIKPSNIIYVRDVPKFADIGLVTDVAATGREVTYLGTEGYIAPEGPGQPSADLYSLGKVLYVISLGMDPLQHPELPSGLEERTDVPLLMELHQISLKACEPAELRYQSAKEMLAALRSVQERMN